MASARADPSKATGIDGAVKTLQKAPCGTIPLMFAAIGFAAYGVYSFALTRYARMCGRGAHPPAPVARADDPG